MSSAASSAEASSSSEQASNGSSSGGGALDFWTLIGLAILLLGVYMKPIYKNSDTSEV